LFERPVLKCLWRRVDLSGDAGRAVGYWRYATQQRNPALRCVQALRDDMLSVDIERVWQANLGGI